jgi:hypothetical protein
MPKELIDYSNTIIYKIFCKDPSIANVYIGHTTNFSKRKYQHKISCSREKNPQYNLLIYKVIRDNGGWDNWDMIELEKYSCKDSTEARIKEQEYYELFKSTLNSAKPYLDPKKCYCNICDKQCINLYQYNKHLNCKYHKNNECDKNMIIKPKQNNNNESCILTKSAKPIQKFNCTFCNFSSNKKSNYETHISTPKHKKKELLNNLEQNKAHTEESYSCINCNKSYKARNSLWYHSKKCVKVENQVQKTSENEQIDKDLIISLIKENSDLNKMVLELCQKIISNSGL